MIDALISGRLHGRAQQRTGQSGKPFVTARVRVPAGEESVLASVIAFNESAQGALLALDDGEAVCLAGALTPRAWVDKEGNPRASIDLVASAVLTIHHARRKRAAVQQEEQTP
jgi:single-stranded DNA-binding protein